MKIWLHRVQLAFVRMEVFAAMTSTMLPVFADLDFQAAGKEGVKTIRVVGAWTFQRTFTCCLGVHLCTKTMHTYFAVLLCSQIVFVGVAQSVCVFI